MTQRRPRHRDVRLVVGAPVEGPHGLQQAFVGELRAIRAEDPLRPIRVLVGSSILRLHLSRLLAATLGGHANVTFSLLKELALEIGAPALRDKGRRHLSDQGRRLLLEQHVAASAHGTYFAQVAGKEGFLEALGATIEEMKEAGVEPAMLRSTAAGIDSARGAGAAARLTAGKLRDVAELADGYDDALRSERYYDLQDAMRAAVERAPAAAGEPGAGPRPLVVVYGFYDATWLQRQLLESCLSFKQGVIFFPCEPAPEGGLEDPFAFTHPLLDWMTSWAAQRIDLPPAAPSRRDVQFLSAPGEPREALEAIRWLVGLARERSIPFGSMALLYRSPEPYRGLVLDLAEGSPQLPAHVADGRPLSTTLPARALLAALKAAEEGYARRSVIDALELANPGDPAALWDRLSREAGIVKGIDAWRDRLGRIERRRPVNDEIEDPARDARALRLLRARVDELYAALSALPEAGSWRAMADAALALFECLPAGGPAAHREAVEACLLELGTLDAIVTPVARERFLASLRRALAARSLPGGRFQRSGIFVGNVMEARLVPFHAVAVVGLVERVFPAPPRQDPILLDAERAEINGMLAEERLPLKQRRADEERLLFALASRAADESLLLAWPRLDPATARPRIPSPYVLRAASQAEGRPVDYGQLDRLSRVRRVRLASLAPREMSQALLAREYDICALRAAARGEETPARIAGFLNSNPLLRRALEAERSRWGERRFTPYDGLLLRPGVAEALRSRLPAGAAVSASRIEEYATCPLRFFLQRVLHLEPLEDPVDRERLDPLHRGALVHAILAAVFSLLRKEGLLPLRSAGVARAQTLLGAAAARYFAQVEEAGLTGHPLMWEIERDQILEDLERVVEAEGRREDRFEPRHFEVRYGMKAALQQAGGAAATEAGPVELEILPGRTIALKGSIDRIDVSPDGELLQVVDYKTGRIQDRYTNDSLKGGTTVQLPLYLMASEKLMAREHPGIRAELARYVSVDRRGGFREVTFSARALQERREALAFAIRTYAHGAGRGVYFAYPDDKVCRWCDYRLACGEGRRERFELKSRDETAEDFLSMRRSEA